MRMHKFLAYQYRCCFQLVVFLAYRYHIICIETRMRKIDKEKYSVLYQWNMQHIRLRTYYAINTGIAKFSLQIYVDEKNVFADYISAAVRLQIILNG